MADGFGVTWEGLHELGDAFGHKVAEAQEATRLLVRDAAGAVERQAKLSMFGRHKAGTETPAVQGGPPAIITGTLRRSIHTEMESAGYGAYQAKVGPSAIYGRRVELEYDYPYMEPALRFVQRVVIPGLMKRYWGRVWR